MQKFIHSSRLPSRILCIVFAFVIGLTLVDARVLALDEGFYQSNDVLFSRPGAICAGSGAQGSSGCGSSFSIATFNILFSTAGKGGRWQDRLDKSVSVIKKGLGNNENDVAKSGLDVVGLQEVRENQWSLLQKKLPGYDIYPKPYGKGAYPGQNPIIWKKDRFELVKGESFKGYTLAGVKNNAASNIVHLRDKSSSQSFYLINGHYSAGNSYDSQRKADADSWYKKAKELHTDTTPVFMTADFNTKLTPQGQGAGTARSNLPYCILTKSPFRHVYDIRDNKQGQCPSNKFSLDGGHTPSPVDHIFASDYVKVSKIKRAMKGYSNNGSDVHDTIMAQVTIPGDCANSETTSSDSFGTLDGYLKALAHQESGGNPTAANPDSSARGKYQYITSTWQARYKLYKPAEKYPTADKAPEEIQDAVAYIEYAQIWNKYKGSVFKLALNHFYPAALSDESLLDKTIGKNKITPREYANSVVEKVKAGVGKNIPLNYTEAPEFEKYLNLATGGAGVFGGDTQKSDSNCDTEGSETIDEGGLTEEQAKKFMMNYGENKNNDSWKAATSGSGQPSANCSGGALSNCTSFSAFFVNKFTDADFKGGDGADVVSNMKTGGVPTGKKPKVFSTFSWSNSSYGHTGIVLGIHGDTIIVGHASCSSPGSGKGNGTEEGGGAGFIKVGKLSDNKAFWGTTPSEFAYPKNIDVNKIEEYVNGKI